MLSIKDNEVLKASRSSKFDLIDGNLRSFQKLLKFLKKGRLDDLL